MAIYRVFLEFGVGVVRFHLNRLKALHAPGERMNAPSNKPRERAGTNRWCRAERGTAGRSAPIRSAAMRSCQVLVRMRSVADGANLR